MAWEEINRNEWSKKFLEELFKGASIPLEGTEGATLSFFSVNTTGDCSLAVKKGGEPRPMFELRIELDWKVEQKVDHGKSIVEVKGQIHVTDFSSEDISSPQMKLICDNQLPPGATPAFKTLMAKLNDAVKTKGQPEVSRLLAEDFVSALRKQV
uniref:Activator of Hsp90 ATPase AHSA1-like N-terminal domain-containing protein n=1 Tax=Alexandrium catenella TaxID=2925 RepID=A0A7S1S3E1_ALECA|mmetsp:Transcript_8389/g.22772  ORF Transcript_8389/g.22772 Transcript_8389/m.22772 type:complete len:154 (+) Transcript_8389:67-528(+)|eukprot:CAMPEP_0171182828 /NCGR_PEP_ID=MMETSP0790-20130122/14969_1 /TAXON_ID=2925 /ORGANISM="Alexandrium catenella, Strain OF101" /LENGTH=153 /DNA_ID=CAMNT_0011647795 /DNA_START=62 /DNA_END=523 /DNA_ORIENTATION=+